MKTGKSLHLLKNFFIIISLIITSLNCTSNSIKNNEYNYFENCKIKIIPVKDHDKLLENTYNLKDPFIYKIEGNLTNQILRIFIEVKKYCTIIEQTELLNIQLDKENHEKFIDQYILLSLGTLRDKEKNILYQYKWANFYSKPNKIFAKEFQFAKRNNYFPSSSKSSPEKDCLNKLNNKELLYRETYGNTSYEHATLIIDIFAQIE